MKRYQIAIIALIVALFLVTQYVVLDKLMESKQREITNVYQGGYNQGIMDAIDTMFEKTKNCQVSTISIGNVTRSVLDVTCLEMNSTRP